MKRIESIFKNFEERRQVSYKAWYSPGTDNFIQFNTNMIHNEISKENFALDEKQALKNGYIRLYVTPQEIDIESGHLPTDREFSALQYHIEKNSYKKINSVIWDTDKHGLYIFPHQSFFFADSIADASEKTK